MLDTEKESADPHVERLLEGFAFLAARVHLKIDDEFPEITEALLSILYPHYIRPIPSMSIVEMHLDVDARRRGCAAESRARIDAEFEARGRRAVPVPDLFRYHGLASADHGGRVDFAGPAVAGRENAEAAVGDSHRV